MSRLRSRSAGSISLFPFLAVLVCAMGALIFLLIVLTRQIRKQAVDTASVQSTVVVRDEINIPEDKADLVIPSRKEYEEILIEKIPVPAESKSETNLPVKTKIVRFDPNIELKKRLKELDSIKAKAFRIWSKNQQKLISEKLKADQAKKQIASINTELEQIELQQGLFQGKTKKISQKLKYTSFAEKEINKKILESKQKSHQVKNQYAFVPYDGKSGTTRRPLLVECTGSVVRIHPEGIELTSKDFKGYPKNYNPVLVVLEVLVKYWSTQSEDFQKPYVLIIIRPGGGAAYYTTRKYISSLDADVGYELVEKDWSLAIPEVNPEAKALAQEALKKILEERRVYLESIALKNPGKYSDQLLATGQGNYLSNQYARRGNGSSGRNKTGEIFDTTEQNREGYQDSGISKQKKTVGNGLKEPELFEQTPNQKNQQGFNTGSDKNIQNQKKQNRGFNNSKNNNHSQGEKSSHSFNEKTVTKEGDSEGFSIHSIKESKPESFMDYVKNRNTEGGDDKNESENGAAGSQGQLTRNSKSRSSRGQSSSSNQESTPTDQPLPPIPSVHFNQQDQNQKHIKQRRKWGLYKPGASIGFERNIPVHFEDREMNLGGTMIDLNQIKSYSQLVKVIDTTTESIAQSWGYPPTSFYWIPKLTFHIPPRNEKELMKLIHQLKQRELPAKIKFIEEIENLEESEELEEIEEAGENQ
jgi:hypothetical protein